LANTSRYNLRRNHNWTLCAELEASFRQENNKAGLESDDLFNSHFTQEPTVPPPYESTESSSDPLPEPSSESSTLPSSLPTTSTLTSSLPSTPTSLTTTTPSLIISLPIMAGVPAVPALPSMPARGHSTAPTFTPDQPRVLRRYFDELEMLLSKCGITDDQEKKKYSRIYVDIDTLDLWESLPEHNAMRSFADFVKAVFKLYPGSEGDRKWIISDMDKLIGEQLRLGIHDMAGLGTYYCAFYTITSFLCDKNHISEAEQCHAFVRGFQADLWNRISRCLELKFPDQYPDEPYPLKEINEAAKFVLHSTSPTQLNLRDSSQSAHSTVSQSGIKSEDLMSFLDKFATTLIKALAPVTSHSSSSLSHDHTHTHDPSNSSDKYKCKFCGEKGHYVIDCPTCARYISKGKIKRNTDDKVVLPSGAYIPCSITGINLRDRVDEYHCHYPGQIATDLITGNTNTTGQMMYGISAATAPVTIPSILAEASTFQLSANDRIAALEQEIFQLRNKRVFDRVEIIQ
jgi:hypothetical protein